jgi:simple sugar transport system permease protein
VSTEAPPQAAIPRQNTAIKQILGASWLVGLLSVVVALVIGAVMIALADAKVQDAASYLFARPSDFFGAAWSVIADSYSAMFRGAIVNPQAETATGFIAPLANTLTQSAPLILAGLGLAIGFRAGLFNIGGQGQILLGATACSVAAVKLDLPPVIHPLVCVIAALVGGAIWGFIPGILKAKTGANEVIVTIMLNAIAGYLVLQILTYPAMQAKPPYPAAAPASGDSLYPRLFGSGFTTDAGFLLALAAVVFTWWLLERSTLGFRLKAVGINPAAAKVAGMNVDTAFIWVLVISGALCGLAATTQVLSPSKTLGLTNNIASTYGFDAITVALLGRSRPLGTLLAGLLFGAFRAGGVAMYIATETPIDIVLVVESVIVLLIAAPPLVKALFRLPDPERLAKAKSRQAAKEVAA